MIFRFCLVFFISIFNPTILAGDLDSRGISFSDPNWKLVTFDGVKPNRFEFRDREMVIIVDHSASAAIFPLKAPTTVKKIQFHWQTTATFQTSSGQMRRKEGDDAFLRVALLIEGSVVPIPFLIPKWIRVVEKMLPFPAARMLVLIPKSGEAVGKVWESPFGQNIDYVAVNADRVEGGLGVQFKSEFTLPKTEKILAVWVMADGDNRLLDFRTTLFELSLQ